MFTVRQAATRLKVHPSTVRRFSKRGVLRTYRNYLGWRLFGPKDVENLRHHLEYLQLDQATVPTEGEDA